MKPASPVAEQLLGRHPLQEQAVRIGMHGFRIVVRSNSAALLSRLRRYFAPYLSDGTADVEVVALQSEVVPVALTFRDWKREPGKIGGKDAYCDLPDGRWVRKLRTGMLFLQSEGCRLAIGPCLENDNQVINFINCQYMNWLQQRDALSCHAAGVVYRNGCLAIAGFSGVGKSTSMLHLLEEPGYRYLTNDRLFLKVDCKQQRWAYGIAKLPRVNPGTLLSLPTLRPLLDRAQRELFEALPSADLWSLEQKHDVPVAEFYGVERIATAAPLSAVLVLNWHRDETSSCTVRQVNLAERPDLLLTIMKSPGPFYHDSQGIFHSNAAEVDGAPYLKALEQSPVFEVTGKVNFERVTAECGKIMRDALCAENC